MPGTVIGKLNNDAREFQAGQSTGFGFRIGEKGYNRETREVEWTNYEAAVFSNKPKMIEALRNRLLNGAVVCVSYQGQRIKQFEGQNGLILSIELDDCKVVRIIDRADVPQVPAAQPAAQPAGNGFAPSHPRNASPQSAAQYGQPAAVQPAAASHSNPPEMDKYDDDIPF